MLLPELPKISKNDNDVQKVMSNFLEKAKQQCTTAQQSSTEQIRMLPPSQPKSSAYKDEVQVKTSGFNAVQDAEDEDEDAYNDEINSECDTDDEAENDSLDLDDEAIYEPEDG